MNSLDPTTTRKIGSGANYQYVNLNSVNQTVRHIKKVKFFLENEDDNRPFVFTLKFILNRSKVVNKKSLISSPTQLISNR